MLTARLGKAPPGPAYLYSKTCYSVASASQAFKEIEPRGGDEGVGGGR